MKLEVAMDVAVPVTLATAVAAATSPRFTLPTHGFGFFSIMMALILSFLLHKGKYDIFLFEFRIVFL